MTVSMTPLARVTVTLPEDLLRQMDRAQKNRSAFVAQAVQLELERRTAEELRLSLDNPHPETEEIEALGLTQWAAELPEDTGELVDFANSRPVSWEPGRGWVEAPDVKP